MNSKKMFYIMAGTVGLLGALLIAVAVVGDRFLSAQSKKLVSLKLDGKVIETQQIALSQAKKDIIKYNDLAIIAKQIVPQEKEQTLATREIVSLAAKAGVSISGISFPSSTLGQAPAKPAAPAPTDTPATPPAAKPSVTQVKPVEGIKNLYQLDINVISDTANPVTYAKLIDFLDRLEKNRRTAQVSQITIQPDSINRSSLNFTLIITVYLKP